MRVGLQGEQFTIGGQLPGHPDGAVAAERADLQDAFGARHAHQQGQELPLIGGDVDRRKPGALVILQDLAEERIVGN